MNTRKKPPARLPYFTTERERLYPVFREYRKANGLLDREDGPAVVYANAGEEWWQNGKVHREAGAAVTLGNGARLMLSGSSPYLTNSAISKLKLPGTKIWVNEGWIHRLDGPAIVDTMGKTQEWWVNGRPHRDDGPAAIGSFENTWIWHGLPLVSDKRVFFIFDFAHLFPAQFVLRAFLGVNQKIGRQLTGYTTTAQKIRSLVPDLDKLLPLGDAGLWDEMKQYIVASQATNADIDEIPLPNDYFND